ncbi:MAG: DNA polymerase III subunit gamma/tau [Methylococcaceae bacterium]|jgi:DNA polymerase-3 subunit gamma/tau
MAYQVLARKWRPQNFTEVVGQNHVVKSLTNALQHHRLHHAYLFTGTRGVGKTTIARILAKAINCEFLQDYNPCGQCPTCLALDQGRFLDLIEVDAASRTKVEDTRDLLENAQYLPSQGRYKIYLIDEVHMLSGHSFNALLKTLEEPPAHVKFLLATTDPHKIPVTVLSRCIQFNLKHLLPSQIAEQMAFILSAEAIDFEPAGIKLLARAADGSMRDGLSLLDQAIVFGGGAVSLEQVSAMLGTVAEQPIEALLSALAMGNGAEIFDKISAIASLTPNFSDVLQQILQVLHRIALLQQVPEANFDDFDIAMVKALADQFSPEAIQLYYQIALIGQRDLDLAPDPRSGFEMVMLRMLAFRPVPNPEAQGNDMSSVTPKVAMAEPTQVKQVEGLVVPPETVKPEWQLENLALNPSMQWREIIAAMKIGGMTQQLANHCQLESFDDKSCKLQLHEDHKNLRSTATEERLQKALQDYCGKPIKLTINIGQLVENTPAAQIVKAREQNQQQAVDAINADENIQALKEHFGARVLPGSIEPVTEYNGEKQ